MRLTVGVKIGGGFFLVTLMLLIAGGIGFGGALKLGGAVDYFASKAWSASEGASSLVTAVQKQASIIADGTSGVSAITGEQREELATAAKVGKTAIDQLRSAEIVAENDLKALETSYAEFQNGLKALLDSHSEYARSRKQTFDEFNRFNEFMKVLEFYANNIYRLPNVDQGDKFDLITSFFKTKLALQTRFYFMQRFLGGDDRDAMLNDLESALEDLLDEADSFSELELAEAEIRTGEFSGRSYADWLNDKIKIHKEKFQELIQRYDNFKQAESAYEAVKNSTLAKVDTFVSQIGEEVNGQAEASNATSQGVYSATIIAIVAGVLIAVGATVFCVMTVVRPIVYAGKRMKDIASGEGDLTQKLPVSSNDEIAYMGKHFNDFVEKIRNIVAATIEIAEDLQKSAERFKSLSDKTSQAASDQQSGSQQIAAALYEMTTSFQEVARNAANAENLTSQANENVQKSQHAVRSNRDAINQLSNEIGTATQVISQLAEESESVAGILNVIRGIAEQTNLLALNAAIEAARAGDQGRGFAVVADEVRTLAQKTQHSTSEIQDVIAGLQAKSAEAVSVIEQSSGRASKSVEFAREVASHLEEVGKAVEDVFNMNVQIAAASEEQASVAEDVNRNVTQISDLSAQTASDASSAQTASADLQKRTTELMNLVHQFKV